MEIGRAPADGMQYSDEVGPWQAYLKILHTG
jgi:hypothetical protein